jgi:hypothetical protein
MLSPAVKARRPLEQESCLKLADVDEQLVKDLGKILVASVTYNFGKLGG